MSTSKLVAAIAAAVLLFWVVGAYNRLTRLRGALVQGFAPLDVQLVTRQAALIQLLDTLEPLLPHAAERLQVLRSACLQFEAARLAAHRRPSDAGLLQSLRLADEILVDARARFPVQGVAGVDLGELNASLSATDAALAFARAQFNAAVLEYNRSMTQFPTMILVGLFGLRLAGQF